ncbi:MAG: hypothetical protein HQL47_01385 [Gammaproteobacteria bacterium]|nr:hypothetical protein [Gammaproteobacteria bacterium]
MKKPKPHFDPDLMAKLDQLLHQQGEYLPLELLLAEGRLLYADYDAWREGRIERLDEQLFGDSEGCAELLSQAAAYCHALGLKPNPCDYRQWGSEDRLCFSTNQTLDGLFQTGYHKDDSHPQLDLFMDNIGNNLVNEAIAALAERNSPKARRAVDQLLKSDPLHRQLDPLLSLLEAADQLGEQLSPAQIDLLQQQIAPLARDLLKGRADDYLNPLWRRAAQSQQGQAYDPAQPQRHSSWFWEQARDWPAAKQAVEQIDAWQNWAELLIRHARASAKLRLNPEVLLDLCQLSWCFPEQIRQCLDQLDGLFLHSWHRFDDSDCNLEHSDFPAWLVLSLPGQANLLEPGQLQALQPAKGFACLVRLVQQEKHKLAADLRAELKAEHPELLRCYLAHKG